MGSGYLRCTLVPSPPERCECAIGSRCGTPQRNFRKERKGFGFLCSW